MVVVERTTEVEAVVALVYDDCVRHLARTAPGTVLVRDDLARALATWALVVFRTPAGEALGVVGREPSGHVHIVVRPEARGAWNPRASLRRALDLFFADCEELRADVPLDAPRAAGLARVLGFRVVDRDERVVRYALRRADRTL